jgi:predicted Fe-Mo cluster-binding NifX family protein
MLLAVPEFKGRVSPTFDFCRRITLWRIEAGRIRAEGSRDCPGLPLRERAPKLQALGVEVLLCGAIGADVTEDVQSRGIQVVSGLSGPIKEVVDGYCRRLPREMTERHPPAGGHPRESSPRLKRKKDARG